MADDIVLTATGRQAIADELQHLKSVEMPALSERIREARALGDLSENFDYQDAKRQQGFINGRMADLQAMLARAIIVEATIPGSGVIGMGSTVNLRDKEYDEEFAYTIVSANEADPTKDRISASSPVGVALMGKKVGDVVEVATPAGKTTLEILSVE